jgi:hypothetical protein
MTTQKELQRWMVEARTNPQAEEAMLQALLSATLYAHIPKRQVPGRMRFIQFIRPDNGQTALPLFTSMAQAKVAVRRSERILAMPGRRLLELTRGALLLLNPNEERIALYPEEVDALLAGRPLGTYINEKVEADIQVVATAPSMDIEEVRSRLQSLYERLQTVEACFAVEIDPSPNYEGPSILLGITVPQVDVERVLRATLVTLQDVIPHLGMPLLITGLSPSKAMDAMYSEGVVLYSKAAM